MKQKIIYNIQFIDRITAAQLGLSPEQVDPPIGWQVSAYIALNMLFQLFEREVSTTKNDRHFLALYTWQFAIDKS